MKNNIKTGMKEFEDNMNLLFPVKDPEREKYLLQLNELQDRYLNEKVKKMGITREKLGI